MALDGVLSAEGADVAGVLGDFHLLHLLTQGGTVSVMNKPCQPTILALLNPIFRAFDSGLMEQSEMQTTSDRFFEERGRKAYLVPYLPVMPTSKSMQLVFLSCFFYPFSVFISIKITHS
jgi:hypothetical protein